MKRLEKEDESILILKGNLIFFLIGMLVQKDIIRMDTWRNLVHTNINSHINIINIKKKLLCGNYILDI